jgi:hypothetical protein
MVPSTVRDELQRCLICLSNLSQLEYSIPGNHPSRYRPLIPLV